MHAPVDFEKNSAISIAKLEEELDLAARILLSGAGIETERIMARRLLTENTTKAYQIHKWPERKQDKQSSQEEHFHDRPDLWLGEVFQTTVSRLPSTDVMIKNWCDFIKCIDVTENDHPTNIGLKIKLRSAFYARLRQDSNVQNHKIAYFAEKFPNAEKYKSFIPTDLLVDVLLAQRIEQSAWKLDPPGMNSQMEID